MATDGGVDPYTYLYEGDERTGKGLRWKDATRDATRRKVRSNIVNGRRSCLSGCLAGSFDSFKLPPFLPAIG